MSMQIFEKEFAKHSYGMRPGKGCKDALRRVEGLLKAGKKYIADIDLQKYYDTIPTDRLMSRLREHIADGRLLKLIESLVKAEVTDGPEQKEPEAGVPQGSVLSPLLSNIYLNSLDHEMEEAGIEMTRYADDIVVTCDRQEEAEHAKEKIDQWCAAEGLTMHPTKTKIVDIRKDRCGFLGYEFATLKSGRITQWPRKSSIQKMKENLRKKTKRSNGTSQQSILAEINRTVRSWFAYFKHSYYTTFPGIDGWIRGRLRSILRKRKGGKGRGRGKDHQRWPNSFFAENGYFSLVEAHKKACQSPKG